MTTTRLSVEVEKKMFKLILLTLAICLTCCLASEDKDRDAKGLITSRGFESAFSTVQTSDGYILGMFRIVNPHWKGALKSPILIQHGLFGSANYWMDNTPGHFNDDGTYVEDSGVVTDCSAVNASSVGNTIPFALAACGYDVWLGNNRGTSYSCGHIKYDYTKDAEFWDYRVDDLDKDVVAQVNHVRNVTKAETIGYIGHSMGTTQMIQVLTENAEFNKIIKPFIALAPVAYLNHINELAKMGALLEPILELVKGPMLILPEQKLKYPEHILSNICSMPIIDKLCVSLFMITTGINYEDNDQSLYPDRIGNALDDTSFKVVAQMAYRADTNTFTKWDYHLTNLLHYGTLTPPKYDLSKITSPNIVFMSGENDLLADPKDVDKMRSELKVKLFEDYIVPDAKWNHMDFMWAKNSGKLVTSEILKVLNKFN